MSRALLLLACTACSVGARGLSEPLPIGSEQRPIVVDGPSFRSVLLGCSDSLSEVRILNRQRNPLIISELRLQDPAGVFSLDAPPLPTTVGPSETLRITARYAPVEAGRDEATLTVSFTDAEPVSLTLVGRASDDPSFRDTFQQTQTLSTDIVFIIDDSSSMLAEQRALRNNIRAFLAAADDGFTDYRIAVTTTDIERVRGRFLPVSEDPDVDENGVVDENDDLAERALALDRWVERLSQPSPEEKFSALADAGTRGSNDEAGLEAARLAVSPENRATPNFGFFRDDALLSFIFVSDEPDVSPGSVDAYVEALRNARADRNVRASAVISPPPNGCVQGDVRRQPARRYAEVARRLGGATVPICEEDWVEILERVSGIALGLQTEFSLSGTPTSEPRVWVDGVERPSILATGTVQWMYDAKANAIVFETLATPPLGASVEVEYDLACEAP